MMGHSHLVFGGTTYYIVAQIAPEVTVGYPLGVGIAIAAIFALTPDLDIATSMMGRRLKFLSYPISAIFAHRTITHSVFPVMAILSLLFFYPELAFWIIAIAIGYTSHIICDCMTVSGVPLFWPIKKIFKIGKGFLSGSSFEFFLTMFFGLGAFIHYFYQEGYWNLALDYFIKVKEFY